MLQSDLPFHTELNQLHGFGNEVRVEANIHKDRRGSFVRA